jgi:hypothetical protein
LVKENYKNLLLQSGALIGKELEAPYNNETEALMKLRYYKRSTVISASRIIPYAKQMAGLSREAVDNATSHEWSLPST